MPKRKKNNALDGGELENWIEGFQEVFGSKVKKEEAVESERDRDVVDDDDVQVSTIGTAKKKVIYAISIIIFIVQKLITPYDGLLYFFFFATWAIEALFLSDFNFCFLFIKLFLGQTRG